MVEGFRPRIDVFRSDDHKVIVTRVLRDLSVGLVSTEAEARLENVRLATRHCREVRA